MLPQQRKTNPLVAIGAILAVLLFGSWASQEVKTLTPKSGPGIVTIEEAKKLQIGMTQQQVSSLLGPPGMTSSDIARMTHSAPSETGHSGWFYDTPADGQVIVAFYLGSLQGVTLNDANGNNLYHIEGPDYAR